MIRYVEYSESIIITNQKDCMKKKRRYNKNSISDLTM